MATVVTLTKNVNVRLSEETIRRCLNIIENSYPNPQDTKRSTDTLAEIFYRNGGFDTTINRKFSESAIKKILKGRFADELSVREFLFFLKLIPQTDPEGDDIDDIDEFLHKPLSKTPSTVSPYLLLKGQLNSDGIKISLSREASEEIQKRMKDLRLSQRSIGEQCNLAHTTICSTLKSRLLCKERFQDILEVFLEKGVIILPEGQTLEQLLYPEAESSYTTTDTVVSIGQNCAAVGGGGRFQHSQRSYNPPLRTHRPQRRPISTPAQKVSWRQGAVPEKGIINPQRLPCPEA